MSKEIQVSHQFLAPDNAIRFSVVIPGEAIRRKKEAIEKAEALPKVINTAEEQQQAIHAAAALKGISAAVVLTHKVEKKPYWDVCKLMDAKKTEFITDIDSRVDEIENSIGDYQRRERDKAAAIEREKQRVRDEADAALKREHDRLIAAENARIAAEEEAKQAERRRIQAEIDASEVKTAAEKRKAKAELEKQLAAEAAANAERSRAQAEADQAEIDASEALDSSAEANASSTVEEAPKATGSAIREKVDFEVTDVEAFYAWDVQRRASRTDRTLPTFVKLEVKKGEFGQYINIASDAELASIPGVKFTKSTKAAVRSVAPQFALQ